MARTFDVEAVAEAMRESREFTRAMFDLVIAESDLRRPPADGFRPILWHLGHVGAFESYWILQRIKGDPTFAPRYDVVFDPIKTPREDANNLPPIAEIDSYLARVREEVLRFMQAIRDDQSQPLLRDGYIYNLVIEHEYQHQETLAYLLQLLAPELKSGGKRQEAGSRMPPASRLLTWSTFPAGHSRWARGVIRSLTTTNSRRTRSSLTAFA